VESLSSVVSYSEFLCAATIARLRPAASRQRALSADVMRQLKFIMMMVRFQRELRKPDQHGLFVSTATPRCIEGSEDGTFAASVRSAQR